MAENNQMIEKKKLNIFQRIRKALLVRNITEAKFEKSPDYLKNDEEVISIFVTKIPHGISLLTKEQKIKMVEQIPELFEKIPNNEKIKVISEKPEYVARLKEYQAFDYVLDGKKYDLIKYLPESSQIKLLTEKIEYNEFADNISLNRERKYSEPKRFEYELDKFSPEAVEKAVILLLDQAKKQEGSDWERKKGKVPLLLTMDITKLPVNTQIKLALLDNDFMEKMSEDAIEKFIGTNPILFQKMNPKAQIAFIKNNPKYFSLLESNRRSSLLDKDYELKSILTEEDCFRHSHRIYDKKLIQDPEVVKKIILSFRTRDIGEYSEYTDFVRNQDTLIEVARFEPGVLSTWRLDNFAGYRKLGHSIELYKKVTQNSEILGELERYKDRFLQTETIKRNYETTNLAKVLLNEKVMSSVEPALIVEFIRNQNINTLKEIIIKTYGEQVKTIFEDRPEISMEQIHNLDIFDPIVVEKFGIGTIHNMLSYNSFSSPILGELVRHPEKMHKFEMFSEIVGDYFEDKPLDFENKLIAFKQMEDLLTKINPEDITPERKDAIRLMINDRNMSLGKNETSIIEVNNLEELDTYVQRRNSIYDEYVQKITTPEELKEAITRRFFGLEYGESVEREYRQTVISARGMMHYYNLENFVSDERTQESELFSNDDLDTLELLTIIGKVNDPSVLKQIYQKLSEKEDILTPVDFNQIRKKIPMQYSKELVDSLLTVEDAKQRAANGESGISYEQTDDGVQIIKLNGANFRILMHSTGLNNSGLQIPYGMDEDEIWKNFEKGCSTISGCVIEPEMLKSCAIAGRINLGFSTVSPKQIIGMSHHDAHVSHEIGGIDPYFEHKSVKFNYPDELVRRTAAQITGQEAKDVSHEYNEVAMYRRNVDASEITEGTYGGRIMPDYLVVYGDSIGQGHMDLAKKFGKEGKPISIILIDTKAYGDRTHSRGTEYRKEDHSKERQGGEIIREVKSLTEESEER